MNGKEYTDWKGFGDRLKYSRKSIGMTVESWLIRLIEPRILLIELKMVRRVVVFILCFSFAMLWMFLLISCFLAMRLSLIIFLICRLFKMFLISVMQTNFLFLRILFWLFIISLMSWQNKFIIIVSLKCDWQNQIICV